MNSIAKRLGIYFIIFSLILIASTTLRTVACFRDLNIYGRFSPEGLINGAGITVAAGVAILLSFIFSTMKTALVPNFSSPANYIPGGMVGAALIFLACSVMGDIAQDIEDGFDSAVGGLVMILLVLLAILSAVHFFLNAFFTESKSDLRAYFALATVLLFAFYAINLYFNAKLPLNAPNKIIDQMAHLCSAIFFLYETRISLGRDKWRQYLAFGFAAALLCGYSSIPALIIYFARGMEISTGIEESVFLCAIFVFVLTRLIMSAFLKAGEKKSGSLAVIAGYASDRGRRVEADAAGFADKYAVQLTIDDLLDDSAQLSGGDPELDDIDEEYPVSEAETTLIDGIEDIYLEDMGLAIDAEQQTQLELPSEVFDEAAAHNIVHEAAAMRANSEQDDKGSDEDSRE
ncbi:MAG: hypothetical protein IJX38_06955 [Clostridia bacterium]|nr:hypothetical protein [Clostridia bacterium]